MEESTCHEMVIHLSQRFSSMLFVFLFCTFQLVLDTTITSSVNGRQFSIIYNNDMD